MDAFFIKVFLFKFVFLKVQFILHLIPVSANFIVNEWDYYLFFLEANNYCDICNEILSSDNTKAKRATLSKLISF